ncbi:hypothetical protein ACFX1Z_018309 [Malus domestica]
MASSDSTIYTCTECRTNLNLTAANLYPPDFFFEAGNKGTVSFAAVDATKFRFDKEDKIRPFFETRNYWGIQWTRTKIKCNGCQNFFIETEYAIQKSLTVADGSSDTCTAMGRS